MIKLIKSKKASVFLITLTIILSLALIYSGADSVRYWVWWGIVFTLTILSLCLTACTLARFRGFHAARRLITAPESTAQGPAKNFSGFFGSVGFHLGMVAVLLGFALNTLSGFRAAMFLPEGAMAKVPGDLSFKSQGILYKGPAPFYAALDKFSLGERTDGQALIRPESTLVFIDGQNRNRQMLRMNYPVTYKGTYWEIADSGYSLFLDISSARGPLVKDFVNIASHGLTAWYDTVPVSPEVKLDIKLYPDFVDDRSGKHSRSIFPDKPVMDITVFRNNQKIGQTLVPVGKSKTLGEYNISFPVIRNWVIFDVRSDPGKYFILLGSLVTIAGLTWRVWFLAKIGRLEDA